jgi:alpha/beta superfamily hydrolase
MFDFSGCGLSEGDYVSFGIKETHDILDLINYILLVK